MVVVADHAVRVDAVDEVIELAHPPVEGPAALVPLAVEPQGLRVVLLQEFADLTFLEFEVGVVVGLRGILRHA